MNHETSDKDETDQDEIKAAAKQAISADNIHERIKSITLKALSERQLDKEAIKSVVTLVLQGVSEGVGDSAERMKPQISEALSGIDSALGKSAIAAQLASEEVVGKVSDFVKSDAKEAIDQLLSLEDMFIDTINLVAKESSTLTANVFSELSEHMQKSGTQSGKEAIAAADRLKDIILEAGKGSVSEIASSTEAAGQQFSQIASGILAGMAEAIRVKK